MVGNASAEPFVWDTPASGHEGPAGSLLIAKGVESVEVAGADALDPGAFHDARGHSGRGGI